MANRRSFLRVLGQGSVSLLAFIPVLRLRAQIRAVAEPGNLELALREAIGQPSIIRESNDGRVILKTPEIAENGAIVPVTVESSLPDVREMLLFVENNPTPLAARFRFEQDMAPFASLRIKMNETCDVLAVVRSADQYFGTRRKVRVMVGGCG